MYCLENALNFTSTVTVPVSSVAVYKQMASIAENKADFRRRSFNLKALELAEKANNGLERASVLLNIAQCLTGLSSLIRN
jgi:hypothetical protein